MKRDVEGFDIWRVLEFVALPEVSDDVHIRRRGTPLASSPDIGALKLSYVTTFLEPT